MKWIFTENGMVSFDSGLTESATVEEVEAALMNYATAPAACGGTYCAHLASDGEDANENNFRFSVSIDRPDNYANELD